MIGKVRYIVREPRGVKKGSDLGDRCREVEEPVQEVEGRLDVERQLEVNREVMGVFDKVEREILRRVRGWLCFFFYFFFLGGEVLGCGEGY